MQFRISFLVLAIAMLLAVGCGGPPKEDNSAGAKNSIENEQAKSPDMQ